VFVNGLRLVPRPLVVLALCAAALTSAAAQDPMRPWINWRTVETQNYRIHFPSEYERWSIDVARRVEAVDSAIGKLVGYTPPKRIDVVVHDPYTVSNGYVIPELGHITSVWWATPPDPRSDVGNYQSWGEMLAAHELTHVAHLTRPSRNFARRALWSLLPAAVGPIAQNSPRWVIEGYPTVIEGQITGSGRPNGVWRPAFLRQAAIEGRLPSYGAMNGSPTFRGQSYAYMNGSAYLEWLLKREGDSTLVHVWRRMTAVTKRTFDQAFSGVYGEGPAALYGRHVAELTTDAMRAKTDLERAGIRDGELVQQLNWETGDPAISFDGNRVALSIRERNKPSRLVVWNTERDSVRTTRRREPTRVRDPQDVPDRSFQPAPRREVRVLTAVNGNPFLYPRWFADNRRVMVTRWTGRADGTSGPDAYIWNTASGVVSRVTKNESVLQADPSPDSREAVAMRCHQGHCDIVRLYFAIGSVTSLLEGSPTVSYHRPRFSPDGQKFVAAVSDSGRWRLIVADRDGKNVRRVGPTDGANRYDAQWTVGSDSLVVVSERGGVPNLELIALSGGTRTITRVTGAAVAPEVNREDHSIWYLSLHARGFSVRRIAKDAPLADTVVTINAANYGFAGVQQMISTPLGLRPGRIAEEYGAGPAGSRWLPSAFGSPDGAGASLTLFRGDIVGRLGTTVTASYGQPGTFRGASIRTMWRYMRPAIEIGYHQFEHRPSRVTGAVFGMDSLDARGFQIVAAASQSWRREGWRIGTRVGAAGGNIDPWITAFRQRVLGFADFDVQLRQMGATRGAVERFRFHVSQGTMRSPFRRVLATVQLSSLGSGFPLEFSGTMGRIRGTFHPFEEFSLGGAPSIAMDSSVMTQRWPMPVLPTGTVRGRALEAWRVAFPWRYTFYAEGASLGRNTGDFRTWNRAIGVETKVSTMPIPVAFAPAAQVRVGMGFSIDNPYKHRFRAYAAVRLEP
jgi:hypothetical protein